MKFFSPKFLLHLEGLVVLGVAIAGYHALGDSWWKFALLFLAPDLSMTGYAFGPRLGAAAYNAAHTYLAPSLLGLLGYSAHWPVLFPLSLIWVAHIGFDRLLGYGLKYPGGFKETHLGRV